MNAYQQHMYNEMMEKKKRVGKTNHILHLLLSLITGGLWLIIWFAVAYGNRAAARKAEKEIQEFLREMEDA